MMSGNSLKTPLGRVRGLGTAKDGTHHWWLQRLTAVATIPLIIWLMVSIVALAGGEQADVAAWLENPLAALLMVLFALAAFWHMKLGLQVVIEDYIAGEGLKIAFLMINNFACIAIAIAVVLATLSLHLGG